MPLPVLVGRQLRPSVVASERAPRSPDSPDRSPSWCAANIEDRSMTGCGSALFRSFFLEV